MMSSSMLVVYVPISIISLFLIHSIGSAGKVCIYLQDGNSKVELESLLTALECLLVFTNIEHH